MRIGIDFGTTHTSAAVVEEGSVRFIDLDPRNADPHILRSMIYVNREQNVTLGLDAVQTFLREDTGREVVMAEKVVGTITNTVAQTSASRDGATPDGPITIVYDVLIDEDIGANGRLLQSIKTGMRSAGYTGTNIFGREYAVEKLVGLILRHVRTAAEAELGDEVSEAFIGRPVRFSDDAEEDQVAEDRLRRAAKEAGFRALDFVPEPVAAAHFYLANVHQPQLLLIFDFGGGTLDLTVMRTDGTENSTPEILATRGVLIGGDDLDSRLMEFHVAPHFGSQTRLDTSWDGRELYMSDRQQRLLYRWQTIPMLSRPEPLKMIEQAIRYGEHPEHFRMLQTLVTQNYGFPLFEVIEGAKRILSAKMETRLRMTTRRRKEIAAINVDMQVTRRQFNQAIADEVADIRSAVRAVVQEAGVGQEEIEVIVTTGGSSAIPIFNSMLTREFPDARFVHSDAYGSVTGGLAILASQRS